MGIILNGGVRQPNADLQRLQFAADTPYETEMTLKPEPQRVLDPEVARAVRQALMGVVAEGTATRLRGAYRSADGHLLPVGGKIGTGDNRLDRFGRGGRLISQRVVDRTATFVFFLGDRSSLARSPPMCPARLPARIILRAPLPFSCSRPSNLNLSRSSMCRSAKLFRRRSAKASLSRPD
jgi:hypothetical protein